MRPDELQRLTAWASVPATTRLVVRVKGQSKLLGGVVRANQLGHGRAPTLTLESFDGQHSQQMERRQIRELLRYEVTPARGKS